MFLPGGGGGSFLNKDIASSRLPGTTTTGSLLPAGSLVRFEATERGMPPPLVDFTFLRDGEMTTGGDRMTESGVLGESWGAVASSLARMEGTLGVIGK